MERVNFRVGESFLFPASDEAFAVMAKLHVSEIVAVEIYHERHNKFASKVHLIFDRIAHAKRMRVRNVRGWVAAMTGRADLVVIDGKPALVPWGTGSRDMREPEFEAFWQDSEQIIKEKILPALQPEDAREILEMMETQTGG